MGTSELKPEWRGILEKRSKKDKIAVAIDCDIAPVGELNVVADLVREGIMVWIDRDVLRQVGVQNLKTGAVRIGINADIYQLTLKGIRICNENGIKKQ